MPQTASPSPRSIPIPTLVPALAAVLVVAAVATPRASAQLAPDPCALIQITSSPDPSEDPSISDSGDRISFTSSGDLTGQNADGNSDVFLHSLSTLQTVQVVQSPTADSDTSKISGNGQRIAFVSNEDLLGTNPDGGHEVFLVDLGTSMLRQLSDVGPGDYASVPSISDDGDLVAFSAIFDPIGGNADLSREVFLYRASTDTIIQVTSAFNGSSEQPVVSGDGSVVYFISNRNLTGQNPTPAEQVFAYDVAGGTLTQLTMFSMGAGEADLSTDFAGDRIAFTSRSDLLGTNPDGSWEIYLLDPATKVVTQLTAVPNNGTIDEVREPSWSGDGAYLAFWGATDLTGANPDGSEEVFLYSVGSATFEQVTSDPVYDSRSPSINFDGSRITFSSLAAFTGDNPDHDYEVYVRDCSVAPVPVTEVPALGPVGALLLVLSLGVAACLVLRAASG